MNFSLLKINSNPIFMKRFLSKVLAISLLATLLPLNLVQLAFAMSVDAGGDQTISLGEEVTVATQADSLDGATTDVVATVNWGDSQVTYVEGVIGADYVDLSDSHTYSAAGDYSVEVTVSELNVDGDAVSEAVDTVLITVEEVSTCSADSYESNDDISDAYELSSGDSIEASLCDEDLDLFKVYLGEGDTLSVEATYTYSDELLGLMLADGAVEETDSSDAMLGLVSPTDGDEVTESVTLTAEDNEYYYIQVLSENSLEVGDYSLTVSVEEAPDYDLYVSDMYLDGTRIYYTLGNSGSGDVDVTIDGGLEVLVDDGDSYDYHYNWNTLSDVDFLIAGGVSNYSKGYLDEMSEGKHTFFVFVDNNEYVDETDETNNSMSFDFVVNADGTVEEASSVDLTVTDIDIDEIGVLTYTVENVGEDDVPDTAVVEATISVLWDGDTYIDETVVLTDESDLSFMSAGGSSQYEIESLGWGGDYSITVYVDSSDQVDEADEDNNELSEDEEWSGFSSSSSDDDSVEDTDEEVEEDVDLEEEVDDNSDSAGSAGGSSSSDDEVEETTEDDGDVELASDEEDTTSGSSSDLADAADEYIDCTSPFTDIDGSFAEKAICLLYQAGTVQGKTETTYDPESDVTRAEFLKMIMLNAGETVEAVELEEDYTDVTDPEEWYYEYVTYGTSIGIVEGYEDGSFGPNNSISRSEAVVMLLRMAGVTDYEAEDVATFDDVDYSDDSWYAYAIDGSVDLGIVEGYEEDNTFRPGENISREEAAVIVRRAWYVWYTDAEAGDEVDVEVTE